VGRGHILELGSGPGWDAAYLERRGVQVTRSDATRAFVE
jgi:protein-L-isoaspartate O-methyltransferase